MNLYAYANNDPINFLDPDGRYANPAWRPTEATVMGSFQTTAAAGDVSFNAGVWGRYVGGDGVSGNAGSFRPLHTGAVRADYSAEAAIGGLVGASLKAGWAAARPIWNTISTGMRVGRTVDSVVEQTVGPSNIPVRDPNTIRFSQDSIKMKFQEDACGTVNDLVSGLRSGKINPADIPPVRLVERDGHLISIDNRRLHAFREAEMPVPYRMATPDEISRAISNRKFTGGPIGIDKIHIRGK